MQGTAYTTSVDANPLSAVQRLGRKAAYNGLYAGLIIGLLSHVIPVSSRDFTSYYIRLWEESLRIELKSYMFTEVEVDMVKVDKEEEEEEPPAPEPEPEPEPEIIPPDPIEPPDPTEPEPTDPPPEDTPPPDDPYADIEPPPEAAQAGNALVQDGLDLTGDGLVINPDGKGYSGGHTSRKGTAKEAVNDPNAKSGGTPGAKGNGPPAPKPRPKYNGPDRSGPPIPIGSWNSCGFPPQANLEQIDHATVLVSVTVSGSGKALRASVQSDPGYGFGSLARSCAMAKRYKPGKSRSGKPMTKTQVYRVKFNR